MLMDEQGSVSAHQMGVNEADNDGEIDGFYLPGFAQDQSSGRENEWRKIESMT